MASTSMSTPQDTRTVPKKQRRAMSDTWFSVLLILPAMIIIAFFALYPLFYAIDVSFRFADLTGGGVQGIRRTGQLPHRAVRQILLAVGAHHVVIYLLCRIH